MSEPVEYERLPFAFEEVLETSQKTHPGDRRDGAIYVHAHDESRRLALEVALITGRPLLLRGPPGCGKSTFALAAARRLGWRCYETVVTSRTEARDLLYRFDGVRRLADAHAGQRGAPEDYIVPGPLWWAIAPGEARKVRPRAEKQIGSREPEPTDGADRGPDLNPDSDELRGLRVRPGMPRDGAVVLIDEIDKAEVELPNDLLVPLGALSFRIEELGRTVDLGGPPVEEDGISRVLVVVTTNDERDLPAAFVRRCVVHDIVTPPGPILARIAQQHFAADPPSEELCLHIAARLQELSSRNKISTAEFLDAVRACQTLGVRPGDTAWRLIERLTLAKR